jgi:hypothetical protein
MTNNPQSSPKDQRELARVAYEAYWNALARNAGSQLRADPHTQFEQLPIEIKNSWQHAAAAAIQTHMNQMVQSSGAMISIGSTYGMDTRQPYVDVRWGDQLGQLDPDTARQLGRDLLDAAASAEVDAFLMGFLEHRINVDRIEVRAGILSEFRKWREEMVFGTDPDQG